MESNHIYSDSQMKNRPVVATNTEGLSGLDNKVNTDICITTLFVFTRQKLIITLKMNVILSPL